MALRIYSLANGLLFKKHIKTNQFSKLYGADQRAYSKISYRGISVPRNDEEEMDADLGAYILLEKSGRIDDIKILLREYKNRHGIKFSEDLLDRVKKYFT